MNLGKALIVGTCLAFTTLTACGHPDRDDPNTPTPVTGHAFFGSQCPYGDFSDPTPGDLELWNCPTGLSNVALKQALQPLIFEVDCKKKVISARNFDHLNDSLWEMMPDGSFAFTVTGGAADLADDGTGKSCQTMLSATVTGQADCSKDRDRMLISVDAVWNFTSDPLPSSATPGDPACKLPTSCYFRSAAKLKQCQ
jgi:hypothetical protein